VKQKATLFVLGMFFGQLLGVPATPEFFNLSLSSQTLLTNIAPAEKIKVTNTLAYCPYKCGDEAKKIF
jgi:hypothetical protein